ncbi:unnamed protein product [Candidula unifasciata]|uniref:Cadherin domain-containing protein n=1 Tax=Candidula unifasciata TaxID=100452 RepID=A0A8S4A638_9EUPU|nr:unnamed protein product [Candidula unifasciata]
MATLLWQTKTIFLVALLVVSSFVLSSMANHPPVISMGIPYTKKKGVLTLSEDTPLNSILAIMECTTQNSYVSIPLVYPKTYKVELVKELDREAINMVEVSIQCSDKGTPAMTTTAVFTIEIVDVNDNMPAFTKQVYNATVKEGVRIGTLVTKVKATDPDAELNGALEYSIQEDSSSNFTYFTIDKESGRIYTSLEIDREMVSEFTLTVVAKDTGLPSHSASAQVKVEVEDVNDNAPVILTKEFHTSENQKPMVQVGIIQATDSDIGKNSELVFSKLEDSPSSSQAPFLIHPNGEILLVVSLDREQKGEYSMEVSVRDKGTPRLSSSATITIFVDDVNDNAPTIISDCLDSDLYDDSPYDSESNESISLLSIDWYSPADDRLVHQMVAVDDDSKENGDLRYAIEAVNVQKKVNITTETEPLFQIDSLSGAISLRRPVYKYDNLIQYLNISVTDNGVPPLSAFCLLSIKIDVDASLLTIPKTDNYERKLNGQSAYNQSGASSDLVLPVFNISRLLCLPIILVYMNMCCF